jgi:hypothetical protein
VWSIKIKERISPRGVGLEINSDRLAFLKERSPVHDLYNYYAIEKNIRKFCKFKFENSQAITGHFESVDLSGNNYHLPKCVWFLSPARMTNIVLEPSIVNK